MSIDLTGACALVTGCRRGMGLAIAEALAAAGADIVGASLNLELDGSETQRRIEAHGRTFTAYRADLGTETGAAELAAAVLGHGHEIDILVNHAGVIVRAPVLDHDDESWRRVVQTNLTSPFVLAREFGRTMVERGRGKIIFTASLLSFQGGVNVVSYAAAKSGIAGVVRALANEWAPHGVNVNAIVPGYVRTDQTQALWDDPVREQEILDRIPAGRWARPADIAGAAVFLASPASDYVHGTLLPVDGGWLGR
jgi:2-dehydro-3-deoxy-D-gluconate 5-dehydrogenase